MKKRLCTLTLALVMCLSILPGAGAIGTSSYYLDAAEFYVADGRAYLNVKLGGGCFDPSNADLYALVISQQDDILEESAEEFAGTYLIQGLYDPNFHTKQDEFYLSGPNAYGRGAGYYRQGDAQSNEWAGIYFSHYWAGEGYNEQEAGGRGESADYLPDGAYALYVWSSAGRPSEENSIRIPFEVSGGASQGAYAPPAQLPVETEIRLRNDGDSIYQPEGMSFPTVGVVTQDGQPLPQAAYQVTWHYRATDGSPVTTPTWAADYYAAVNIRGGYLNTYLPPEPVKFTVYRSTAEQPDGAPYLTVAQIKASEGIVTVTGGLDPAYGEEDYRQFLRTGIEYVLAPRAVVEAAIQAGEGTTVEELSALCYDNGLRSVADFRRMLPEGAVISGACGVDNEEESLEWTASLQTGAQWERIQGAEACILAFSVNDYCYQPAYLYLYTFSVSEDTVPSGGYYESQPEKEAQTASVELPDIVGHWAEESIRHLAEQGIMTGYPNGNFGPDDLISRGEFATVLARFYGLEVGQKRADFIDTGRHWAGAAIKAVSDAGLMNGIGGKYFAPDETVTREQLATVLARAQKLQVGSVETLFKDDEMIAGWARESVYAARNAGVVAGYPNGNFGPKDVASRGQVAEMLFRLM